MEQLPMAVFLPTLGERCGGAKITGSAREELFFKNQVITNGYGFRVWV
jgi:hypothetical protein